MYRASGSPTTLDPVWARMRNELLRVNREFRDAKRVPSKARPLADPPLVGPGRGRLWEVRFHRPRFSASYRVVGVTTAIRWDEPENMRNDSVPWLYVGARPRAFTRSSLELDRIVMRYKRSEGDLRGLATGDEEFDRRWAVYAPRPAVGDVMRDPATRRWLNDLAELRPRRGDDLPVVASFGATAILSIVVDESDRSVKTSGELPQSFGNFLDHLETAVGEAPASVRTLPMELVPDELGYPVPVIRFRCSFCGQETHPRYQPAVDTEVCDRCGKGLYRSP
jgi:hypothetical protein